MRRAVRDYKYEVNEGKMTEECVQYLTQLQKDWERHRVKLGVEALRKEVDLFPSTISYLLTSLLQMTEKERDGSISSYIAESSGGPTGPTPSVHTSSSDTSSPHNINVLFGTLEEVQSWKPTKPPPTLGELLDSRFMLPLLFPSDPRMLAALPQKPSVSDGEKREKMDGSRPVTWRFRNKKLREVGVGALQWIDGVRSAARWVKLTLDDEESGQLPAYSSNDTSSNEDLTSRIDTHVTPLTRQPSVRKGRHGVTGELFSEA
ncbi:hypothetical protein C0993_008821 [Termitomyces sp. T159_Od127]|nr:hypothetical protein C0993_008821 [Termitomyces sp. T159_Od127]